MRGSCSGDCVPSKIDVEFNLVCAMQQQHEWKMEGKDEKKATVQCNHYFRRSLQIIMFYISGANKTQTTFRRHETKVNSSVMSSIQFGLTLMSMIWIAYTCYC